jgi:N-succinyldiaminopimelate aminotransferase
LNPRLKLLQPYPFERLRQLLGQIKPTTSLPHISLSIGEPRHPTPSAVTAALCDAVSGLASYPATAGAPALREAIARWLARRYGIGQIDPATQILPVNGSREALFSFVQTVIEPSADALVLCPNPFYQIYEGAALLAGAQPWFINQLADHDFKPDWRAVPDSVWQRCQLLFVCSPGNPTGAVIGLDDWRTLFELSDRYGFIIASDECYSEIYFDETKPPLGGLEAALRCNRPDFRRLVVFSSLSKRSNAPGLRSGFVAGDADLIRPYLLYRTYHGSAMSPTVQAASITAWEDETHVVANRTLYAEKFAAVVPRLRRVLQVPHPDAGFYLWVPVPDGDDLAFCQRLYADYNVTVLPGSFLARNHLGVNPGAGHVRLALVDQLPQCIEAAERIVSMLSATPNP